MRKCGNVRKCNMFFPHIFVFSTSISAKISQIGVEDSDGRYVFLIEIVKQSQSLLRDTDVITYQRLMLVSELRDCLFVRNTLVVKFQC